MHVLLQIFQGNLRLFHASNLRFTPARSRRNRQGGPMRLYLNIESPSPNPNRVARGDWPQTGGLIVMKIIAAILLSCFALLSAQGADPKTNWMNNCMQCHGSDGSANTSMGKALNAKDLTNPGIQSSFTDAQ